MFIQWSSITHTNHQETRQKNSVWTRVKDEVVLLKQKIVENIMSNIKDQCDENTYYYNWSGFDLDIKLSPVARKERLKDLVTLFCTQRNHTVVQYTNVRETPALHRIFGRGMKFVFAIPQKFLAVNWKWWLSLMEHLNQ